VATVPHHRQYYLFPLIARASSSSSKNDQTKSKTTSPSAEEATNSSQTSATYKDSASQSSSKVTDPVLQSVGTSENVGEKPKVQMQSVTVGRYPYSVVNDV
jgi:hypothetical protein